MLMPLAWETEKATLGLKKLNEWFLDDVEEERAVASRCSSPLTHGRRRRAGANRVPPPPPQPQEHSPGS